MSETNEPRLITVKLIEIEFAHVALEAMQRTKFKALEQFSKLYCNN